MFAASPRALPNVAGTVRGWDETESGRDFVPHRNEEPVVFARSIRSGLRFGGRRRTTMVKGKRADQPSRHRAALTTESGAHARLTSLDSRRIEDFAEPDAELVALAKSREEHGVAGSSSPEDSRSLEALEHRLHELEEELEATRESLRQKQLELSSLRAPVVSPAESLRIPLNPLPAEAEQVEVPPLPPPPRSLLPSESGPDSGDWQPASRPSIGYPVLQHVAVALRASTLPPAGPDSVPPSQRKAPRRSCEIELAFTEETQFYTGLTQDISEGGVFVATYRRFPIGTRLELSFELPDGTLVNTWGRVRWLRDESADNRPGMGVEFGELREDIARAIARFCEQRAPLYVEI